MEVEEANPENGHEGDGRLFEVSVWLDSQRAGGSHENVRGAQILVPAKNPFRRDSWNLTEQMRLLKRDSHLAARLRAEGDGSSDTTIVTLMDDALSQSVRADFQNPSPSFDITSDSIIDIIGSA